MDGVVVDVFVDKTTEVLEDVLEPLATLGEPKGDGSQPNDLETLNLIRFQLEDVAKLVDAAYRLTLVQNEFTSLLTNIEPAFNTSELLTSNK